MSPPIIFHERDTFEQAVDIGPVTLVYRLDKVGEAFRGDENPVVEVSWNESAVFSALFGLRLLTEEEWEAAARGTAGRKYGTSTGELRDAQGRKLAHVDEPSTAKVGSYAPNEFGLYDMTGNVLEWTSSHSQEGEPYRVLRGGSWNNNNPQNLRAAYRNNNDPDNRNNNIGFRVARLPQHFLRGSKCPSARILVFTEIGSAPKGGPDRLSCVCCHYRGEPKNDGPACHS